MSILSILLSGRRSRREVVDDMPQPHPGMTVTLELRRQQRRLKERNTTSYPTCDTGEYEPPWVSARRANLENCRFYRLPEELVLQILGTLDYVSKAIALRTCGLFIRIMFDQNLLSQSVGFRFPMDVRVWPPFEPPVTSIPFEAHLEVVSLRKQVHRLLDRDRFCDPCRQFREDGRYEKAVQALQGTLWCSYCKKVHKRPLFSPRQRDTPSATRICVLTEGKAPFCAHLSIGWDSPQNGVSTRQEPCGHPDHDPPSYWDNSFTYQRPYLFFWRPGKSDAQNLVAQTSVFLFRLHHAAPVTRAWLQGQLTTKAHVLDRMLCPHVTARDGQLLLPFGPDRCGCFDCPRWIDHNCTSYDLNCCRCNSARVSNMTRYFMPGEFNLSHTYQCAVCQALYDWRRYGSAVYLEMKTLNGCNQPGFTAQPSLRFAHWLYKIHPESWGILNDEELHHVAWCNDINCASRWRWERLSRLWRDA